MDSLPGIAALLRPLAAGTPPALPTASPSTAGLFEHEIERALERAQEDGGAERAVEQRSLAVRERRLQRHASFEHSRAGGTRTRGAEPEPVLESLPVAPEPVSAPVSDPPSSGSPSGDLGSPASPGGDGAARNAGSTPPTASAAAQGAPGAPAVQAAPGGGVVPAGGAAGAQAPAVGAVRPVDGTQAFLAGARGPRGNAAGPLATGTERPPASADAELVDHAAEVLRRIRLALDPAARRMVVDLEPEELGRLQVRMALRDGRVSTVVRAESPQTLELLERHLPELRAVFAERGIDAGRLELQLGFGGAPRDGRRGTATTRFAARASGPRPSVLAPIEESVPALASNTSIAEGRVDTYA